MPTARPVLYILMRTDMASLTHGKAMAQAAHAANMFTAYTDPKIVSKWAPPGSLGFGTTVVLSVTKSTMRQIVERCHDSGYPCGVVRDGSYPIKDGNTTHYVSVDTCAYVFTPCKDSDYPPELYGVKLHQ